MIDLYKFLCEAHSKSMKVILIVSILIFILLIITYPFRIKWSFHFNVLENIGFVVFKVLFIRLLCERFKINNKCEIETEREKKKSKKSEIFFHSYIYNLAKRVDVKRIEFFSDIGFKEDACFISLCCGVVNVSIEMLKSLFLVKYDNVKLYTKNSIDYENNKLEFTGKIVVCFNLVVVFLSLIQAFKFIRNKGDV